MYKYPIPGKQGTKVRHWLKETGGIAGQAFGLEADAMPRERVKRLVREVVEGLPK